jgi:hypothetical protein
MLDGNEYSLHVSRKKRNMEDHSRNFTESGLQRGQLSKDMSCSGSGGHELDLGYSEAISKRLANRVTVNGN